MKPLPWQRQLSTRYQNSLMSLTSAQDKELQKIVARAAKQSQAEMLKIGGKNVSAVVRRAQYAAARNALSQISQDMWSDVSTTITKNMGTASMLAVNENRELLSILTRAVGAGRAAVLADSMMASAAETFGALRSRLLNNINLSPNVFKNNALMMGKVDDVVNSGLLLGQSAREIAGNVQKYINPSVMGGPRYAAMRLGRTEINNAYHTTTRESYRQSPYVTGVQWSLSGSHPKPDTCNAYAEEDHSNLGPGIYLPDDVPDKPHPQCFCFITAVTPSPKEFLTDLKNGEFACGSGV